MMWAWSLTHRDYTNPYLPVAPFATDPGMLGLGIQAPINANPQEGNVLLAQVCQNLRMSCPNHGVCMACSPCRCLQWQCADGPHP